MDLSIFTPGGLATRYVLPRLFDYEGSCRARAEAYCAGIRSYHQILQRAADSRLEREVAVYRATDSRKINKIAADACAIAPIAGVLCFLICRSSLMEAIAVITVLATMRVLSEVTLYIKRSSTREALVQQQEAGQLTAHRILAENPELGREIEALQTRAVALAQLELLLEEAERVSLALPSSRSRRMRLPQLLPKRAT